MFIVPESCRVPNTPGDAQSGIFSFQNPQIPHYAFMCVASNGMGWEHVSVTLRDLKNRNNPKPVKRSPTWLEMCYVKSVFWHEDDAVIQIHPPKSEHVSTHPFCLHLWRPTNQTIQYPPSELVGFKGDNKQTF